jgi:hypothetical protein
MRLAEMQPDPYLYVTMTRFISFLLALYVLLFNLEPLLARAVSAAEMECCAMEEAPDKASGSMKDCCDACTLCGTCCVYCPFFMQEKSSGFNMLLTGNIFYRHLGGPPLSSFEGKVWQPPETV